MPNPFVTDFDDPGMPTLTPKAWRSSGNTLSIFLSRRRIAGGAVASTSKEEGCCYQCSRDSAALDDDRSLAKLRTVVYDDSKSGKHDGTRSDGVPNTDAIPARLQIGAKINFTKTVYRNCTNYLNYTGTETPLTNTSRRSKL